MAVKDIFCAFESADGLPGQAFRQALALAKAYQAHLSIVSVCSIPFTPGGAFVAAAVSGAIKTANDALRQKANAAAGAAGDEVKAAGVSHDAIVYEGNVDELSTWASVRARCADFSVVDRAESVLLAREAIFERVLFSSGRPVLVAGADVITPRIEKICVGWNGSSQAARALGDAMGLFPDIKTVEIVTIGPGVRSDGASADDAAAYVARHDIRSTVVNITEDTSGVARTIDEHARNTNADLIVMGGFGRSRILEFVLGGVTRELSMSCSVPLFLAH